MMKVDLKQGAKIHYHSKGMMAKRLLWMIVKTTLFRFSFRTWFGYRCFLLRLFGAKIGKGVRIYSNTDIVFPWNLEIGDYTIIAGDTLIYTWGYIKIGSNVNISHKVQICAASHDYTDPLFRVIFNPVVIEDQVWICTQAFVGPGVVVKEGALLGACCVLMKDAEAWTIYAGNPARKVSERILVEKSRF